MHIIRDADLFIVGLGVCALKDLKAVCVFDTVNFLCVCCLHFFLFYTPFFFCASYRGWRLMSVIERRCG